MSYRRITLEERKEIFRPYYVERMTLKDIRTLYNIPRKTLPGPAIAFTPIFPAKVLIYSIKNSN
jgi:hypothetical protein